MRRATLLILLLLCAAAPAVAQGKVTVFAAASLRGVLEEVAELPALQDVSLRFSYGGSGTLARQVAAGAPADAILLASPDWMSWLQGKGVIAAGDTTVVAGNRLVLVGPEGAENLPDLQTLPDRLTHGRLAMGHRQAVPAGVYARQWLETAGLWETLQARLAETDNVRAALALVAQGHAPLGIVYASDAATEPRVQVLWQIAPQDHDAIRYPAAVLTPAGATFVEVLQSAAAASLFASHGFEQVAE